MAREISSAPQELEDTNTLVHPQGSRVSSCQQQMPRDNFNGSNSKAPLLHHTHRHFCYYEYLTCDNRFSDFPTKSCFPGYIFWLS